MAGSREEMAAQAVLGYRAQPTLLDKFNYVANYVAYASVTQLLYNANKDPEIWDDNDNLITDKAQLDEERRKHPDAYFTPEEQRELGESADLDKVKNVHDISNDLITQLGSELGPHDTIEGNKQAFQFIGMLLAQYHLELGRHYEANLKSLPENEENREQKAEYLTLNDNTSTIHYDKANLDIIERLTSMMNLDKNAQRQNSMFKNVDTLKNTPVRDYVAQSMFPPDMVEKFYAKQTYDGKPIDPEMSVYDYFVSEHYKREQKKKQNAEARGENYEIKEPDDDEIIVDGFNLMRDSATHYYMNTGKELVMSNLSYKDQNSIKRGEKLENIKTYEPPKAIRDWVNVKGHAMTYKNRTKFINSSYEGMETKANEAKPTEFVKNAGFGGAFSSSDIQDPKYKKYMDKHFGANVLHLSLSEKKAHLAKFMAATVLHDQIKPFSASKIESMAKTIEEMDEFRKLDENEVDKGLINTDGARLSQFNIVQKTYRVPPEKVMNYIRDMRKLANNMVAKGNQSEEYKLLNNSVKNIAELNPSDPDIESKLINANTVLFNSIVGYAKGKKSVRTYEEGRSRFDNCMDALSIMKDNVSGIGNNADSIVERTNSVRKVQSGQKDFVDLKNFGAKHAEESRAKKTQHDQQPKNKQQEVIQP